MPDTKPPGTAPASSPVPPSLQPDATVVAVLVGRVGPLPGGADSAIAKKPRAGRVWAGPHGLDGDEQGDRLHHGGLDKAIHVMPTVHAAAWQAELAEAAPDAAALLAAPGAFGENLALAGWCEPDVCVGDVWQVGGARLEVSQGRQPCSTLNRRFGVPQMARRMQDNGRTGWYLRVQVPGAVGAGDAVRLLARPHPSWSIARVWRLLYHDLDRWDDFAILAHLPALDPGWRALFGRRVASRSIEDWSRRLGEDGR